MAEVQIPENESWRLLALRIAGTAPVGFTVQIWRNRNEIASYFAASPEFPLIIDDVILGGSVLYITVDYPAGALAEFYCGLLIDRYRSAGP